MDSGQIAHSALKFTLNLQTIETPTCNIINNFGMDKDLQTCKLIIYDKYTMAHKKLLETLDRTLKYLKGNGQFFDGALILMTGEFRKTLRVLPHLISTDELNKYLKSLILLWHVNKLILKIKLCIRRIFQKHLLDIGNGMMSINRSIQCTTLSTNFLKITSTEDEFI